MRTSLPLHPPAPGWMKNTRLVLFSLLLAGLCQTSAQAQITLYNYTNAATGAPASVASGLSGTSLKRGSDVQDTVLSCTGPTQGFGGDHWPTTNTFDVDAFNTAGDYIQFSLKPNGGNSLKITAFTANSRRENPAGTVDDGPIAIRYAYKVFPSGSWVTVNPGNPQSSNNCSSVGVQRIWSPFPMVSVPGGDSIVFRIYGLSGGANRTGDLYLRNVVVSGFLCDDTPFITLNDSALETCPGSSTLHLTYSATSGDLNNYSIDYNAAAEAAGFLDQASTALPVSPPGIPVIVPGTAGPGTYHGTLRVYNNCGITADSAFTVTVHPLPTVNISGTTTICSGESTTLTASGGGTYVWSTDDLTASTTVSPSGTTTYFVTVTNLGCSTVASVTVTVTPIETVDAGPDRTTCVNGVIHLAGTVGGAATGGTWSDDGLGGSFLMSPSDLGAYYAPPADYPDPIALILTTNGPCPVSDTLIVTYGPPPPLTLTASGPANPSCGDTIVVTVAATSGFIDLTSNQYSLDWSASQLMLLTDTAYIIGVDPPGINIMPGHLVYAWAGSNFEGESLIDGTVLLKLTMKVIGSAGSADVLITGSMATPIEAYNSQTCSLTVNTNDASIDITPIEVSCPPGTAVCVNAPAFTLTGENPAGGTYSGPGVSGNIFNPALASIGPNTVTYSYTGPNGCSNTCTLTVTVNPLPLMECPADQSVCMDAPDFSLSGGLPAGGSYSGVGVSAGSFSPASAGIGTHSITYTYTDGNGCTNACNFDIAVNALPDIDFSIQVTGDTVQTGGSGQTTILDFCEGDNFSFPAFSISDPYTGMLEEIIVGGTTNTTYDGGGIPVPRPQSDISFGNVPGFFGAASYGPYGLSSGTSGTFTQVFTPYIDIDANGVYDAGTDCLGEPFTLIYNIYAAPEATLTVSDNEICTGESVTVTFTEPNYPIGTPFTVTVDVTDDNGTQSLSFFDVFTGDDLTWTEGDEFDGTITVSNITVTGPGGCSSSISDFTVTVNPKPVLSATINGVTVANNNDGIDDTGAFSVCNTGTDNVFITAFSDLNNVPGNVKAYQTIVLNNATAPFCNNCTALVTAFPGAMGTVSLINPTLPGSLVMSFRAFVDVDNDDVLDPEECAGDWIVYTITVNPVPNAVATPASQMICSGGAITTIALSGDVAGTVFNWTRDNTAEATGIAASGSGNISGSLTNTTNSPVTVTFTITPMADGCTGAPISATVTVKPAINLSISPATTTNICSGDLVNYTISTTLTSTVTFDLTLESTTNGANPKNLSIENGLPITLTGLTVDNANPYNFSQAITNALGAFDRGRVRIRLTNIHLADMPGCTLANMNGEFYQVFPKPRLLDPADPTICSGASTGLDIDLDGLPPANTTGGFPMRIEWTVVAGPNISGASASVNPLTIYTGAGVEVAAADIAQVLTNSGTSPETVVYTITPRSSGPTNPANGDDCYGDPISVTVTVNPVPNAVAVPATQTICSGDTIQPIALSGNVLGTVFNWTRDNVATATGIAASGSGNISGALTNTTNAPVTVTFTITPMFGSCPGAPVTASVTVQPSILPSLVGPDTVNVGATIFQLALPGVNPSGNFAGGTWVSSNLAIADTSFVTDTTTLILGVAPGTIILTYQATDNAGCTATVTKTIWVVPALQLTVVPTPADLTCGETFTVTIQADNFVDLYDLQYTVNWDPAQLQYVDHDTVPVGSGSPAVSVSSGALTYSWSDYILPQSVSNGFGLIHITFQAISSNDTAAISLTNAFATNSSFSPVPVTTVDSSVIIQPIQIVLGSPGPICPIPCPATIAFPVLATTGNPNQYSIDWNAAANTAGFNDITEADFDPNDPNLLVIAPCGLTSGSYAGTLVVTDTVTGCTSLGYSIVITVDETPPSISLAPGTLSAYNCPSLVPDAMPAPVVVSDNCSGNVVVTLDSETQNGAGCVGNPMTITRIYKATDAAGNMAFLTHLITVVDDVLPEIELSGFTSNCFVDTTAAKTAVLDYANLNKSDNCSAVTVSISSVSAPSCASDITVIALDACGNSQSFVFPVKIDGIAPTVVAGDVDDCYETVQDAIDAALAVTSVSDNCPGAVEVTAVVEDLNDLCNATIIVTATDSCGNTATVEYFPVRIDNTPPIILAGPVSQALSGLCFTSDSLAIAAAIDQIDEPGSTIDGCPGAIQFDGYVDPSSSCPYTVVITATDVCGNFSTILFENVFIDSLPPEVIDATPDTTCFQTAEAAIAYSLSITTWSDDCTPYDSLIVVADYTQDGAGPLKPACETGVVTIRVTDHCGLTDSVTYAVTIDAIAPGGTIDTILPVPCIDDLSAAVDTSSVHATDNCTSEEDLFVEHVGDTQIGYQEDCAFLRTYQVTDCAGNVATLTQIINVNDTEQPVWLDDMEQPINEDIIGVSCDDPAGLAFALNADPPAVSDNCSIDTIIVSVGDPVYSEFCDHSYNITILWTAIDQCGNEGRFNRTIEVVDNESPSFAPGCQFMPLNIFTDDSPNVDCPSEAGVNFNNGDPMEVGDTLTIYTSWLVGGAVVPAMGDACVSDNCSEGSEIVVVVADIEVTDVLPCQRTITLSFQLSDACGNVEDTLFVCVYNIIDNTDPVFTQQPGSLDRTVSCSDAAALAAAQALAPTATDNCTLVPVLTKTADGFVSGGPCPQIGTYTNTWTVADSCGNTAANTFVQVIHIIDVTPPVFTSLPGAGNATVQCSDAIALANAQAYLPTATDNCGGTVTYTKTGGTFVPGNVCPQAGTITNSFTATDGCGNTSTSSFVQVITIIDNISPVVSAGSIAGCYPTVAAAQAAAIAATSATDNCSITLTKTASTTGTCSAVITVTVTDQCGNAATVTYATRIDNEGPTVVANCSALAPSYPTVAEAQAAVQAHTTVTDNCPGPLTLTLNTTGTCQAIVTITATDGCGNSNSAACTTSITATPLAIVCPSSATRTAGAQCTYTIVSTEFDPASVTGGCPPITTKYTLSGATVGGPVTASTLAGVVLLKGVTTITWTASDLNGGTTSCSFTVTVNDTQAPVIVCPANVVVNNAPNTCSAVVTYATPVGTDNCMVTTTQVNGLPSGATFPVGTTVNAFLATDMSGNSAFCSFNVTVNDNQPPVIVCPANIVTNNTPGQCSAVVNYTVTASDNCGGTLTPVLINGLASGSTFPVGTSGPIQWRATDGAGNTANCSFTVTVNDTQAPNIVCPANISVPSNPSSGCSAAVTYTVTASDNCTGTPTLTLVSGGASGSTFTGTSTVVWRATDAANNSATCSFTVTVTDNTLPVVTCPVSSPQTRSTNVNDCFYTVAGAEFNATASDNCGTPTLTYSLSGATSTPVPPNTSLTGVHLNKGTTTVTWIASDGGGNSASCSFTVTVNDTRPPVVSCPPNITVNAPADACSATVNLGTFGSSDNCGIAATVIPGNVLNVGTHVLTYTATDLSGLTAFCTQTVVVRDVTPPVIADCPTSTIVLIPGETNCQATYGATNSTNSPTATDNCAPAPAMSWTVSPNAPPPSASSGSGDIPSGQLFAQGTTLVTYTATDINGNTAVCTYTVSVTCIKISGRIIWEDMATGIIPVVNATVRLTDGDPLNLPAVPAVSTSTDMMGMYMLSTTVSGEDLTITPTKPAANSAQKLNGVTSADAAAIQAHVAGTTLITNPYKMVAADVNHTNTITTIDASLITSALMGNPLALAAFDTSWRFLRQSLALPTPPWPALPGNNRINLLNVTTDQINQDFIGIKIGNVNGSPINPALAPSSPLVWMVNDQVLEAGQEVTAVFSAAHFNDLAAYQFALDFDPTLLEMIDIQTLPGLPITVAENFGTYNLADGEIRTVWSNAYGYTLADGTPVFKVKFKALASGAKLSEVLHLNDAALAGKAFNAALVESDVQLVFTDLSVTAVNDPQASAGKVQLLQNRPNPFNEETTIGFILPDACEARLRIMDVEGREIATYQREYSAGYHEIVFRATNASSYGILYYELTTPSGRLIRKMISTGK